MSSIRKGVIVTVVLFTLSIRCLSQFKSSGYEIGINAGTLIYQGELTPKFYGYTKSLRPAIGLYVSKSLGTYFDVHANLTRGKILADESNYSDPEWMQHRNFKFSSRLTELSATLVFKPLGENSDEHASRLSPYVFEGAGVAFLNVKRDWSGFDANYFDPKSVSAISLGADTVHSLPKVIPVIPIGAGLSYILSPRLALNTELTWRYTPSDYVDGFRHNDQKNNRDSYYGVSVGLSFRFGSNMYKCPKVK